MAWDFSTDPDFELELDWVRALVRDDLEPLDGLALPSGQLERALVPIKRRVKERGLWAPHLPPSLGGQGRGCLELALLNEVLGRSSCAPAAFGAQAPDSGNAEILALFGTPDQKDRYLQPLLDGRIRSCFSMTEPGAGADPTLIRTRARRDGDDWVLDGHKWFSSGARSAAFLIVMAVTDPDVPAYQGMSMFLVPRDTAGVIIEREAGTIAEPGDPQHALIHYDRVRVPGENLLGGEGQAFVVAQKRLGGGRIHHVMRWLGQCQRAFDMMCERAVSRFTAGSLLADKQSVQNYIADSWAEMAQLRLFTLHTAWLVDRHGTSGARTEIAALKFAGAKVLHDVVDRAVQVHGALGVSTELPLGSMYAAARLARLYDGPDEVHRVSVARRVLKGYAPVPGDWPSEHLPSRRAAAQARLAELIAEAEDAGLVPA